MTQFALENIVDVTVFTGAWPFRNLPYRSLTALKGHLYNNGVRQAWVASAEAILHPDPMPANEDLLHEAAGDSFWRPVVILNPSLPGWEEDAQLCLEHGARAFKLTPNYHSYDLSLPQTTILARMAEAEGVPICAQIRMMDERTHHPLMKVPGVNIASVKEMALRHPTVRFLACGVYARELRHLAEARNIWAEISLVEQAETLKQAISVLGRERVLFGSHSPFITFASVAAKLTVSPAVLDEATVDAVKNGNAKRLLAPPVG